MTHINRRRARSLLLSAGLAGALAAVTLTPGTAAAGHRTSDRVVTVADGLDNPRGLAFGRHGVLFVAESGRGGTGPCVTGPEGDVCYGRTGALTAVWGSHQWPVIRKLPSLAAPDGSQALGPSNVDASGRSLLLTIGLGNDPAIRDELPGSARKLGTLQKVGFFGARTVADIAGFEADEDPDGAGPDSNPHSVLATRRGPIVVDAGGNSLVKVRPGYRHARLSALAVFPDRVVEGPGGPMPMQSVPTNVVRGPDGALYVSELTGFPFPVDGAQIYRVRPGHQPKVVADGFTNVIDLAFDSRGRLYVLEIATNGLLSGDLTGALIRVNRDGSQKVILSEGLFAPGGLTIRGQHAYVSNCGVCAGDGTVLRIPLR